MRPSTRFAGVLAVAVAAVLSGPAQGPRRLARPARSRHTGPWPGKRSVNLRTQQAYSVPPARGLTKSVRGDPQPRSRAARNIRRGRDVMEITGRPGW